MNQDALMFLVEAMPRLRAIVMMVETGKKYVPNVTPEPADVPKAEIKAAVGRFLEGYEKRGFDAAKALYKDLQNEAAGHEDGPGFFRPSRETEPVLKLNALVQWIEAHSQMPDWDARKAVLEDIPALWADTMRDLKRAA